MTATTEKSQAFWRGVKAGTPFLFVVGPFALLFGVLASEAGLSVFVALTFSFVVVAGAAQFTALQLMSENAPTLIVLISALAVNLRMAMYSASLTPYLGEAPLWQRALAAYFIQDQAYACSIIEFEARPKLSVAERMSFFVGSLIPVIPAWYVLTFLGAAIGRQIPDSWALDFALPITFIAMLGPMMRTIPHVIAAFVSVVVSILAAGIPYSLGLLIAGTIAMVAGARAELFFEQRKNSS
ncbi:MAG: AzlC family ABC transporter permease [Pseudomonadota bacterium]